MTRDHLNPLPLHGEYFQAYDQINGEFAKVYNSVTGREQRRILKSIQNLCDRSIERLREPHCKKIQDCLFEIKPDSQIRIPFCFSATTEKLVVILGAFKKKQHKWRKQDIEKYLAKAQYYCK